MYNVTNDSCCGSHRTGTNRSGETPVLVKCHPIMSSSGLCPALKETPHILRIALMLSDKLLPVPMKC